MSVKPRRGGEPAGRRVAVVAAVAVRLGEKREFTGAAVQLCI